MDLELLAAFAIGLDLPPERAQPAWHRDAACREHPEIDFVPRGEWTATRALAVCRSCLCRRECLTTAMRDEWLVGLWGGTTTNQRKQARRQGLSVDDLLAESAPRGALLPAAPPERVCPACGGRVGKRDAGPYCWACAPQQLRDDSARSPVGYRAESARTS